MRREVDKKDEDDTHVETSTTEVAPTSRAYRTNSFTLFPNRRGTPARRPAAGTGTGCLQVREI